MLEFRGASALVAVALLGILTLAGGGLTLWWLSRPPRLPKLGEELGRRFWWSWALALMSLVGLLMYAMFWFPSS